MFELNRGLGPLKRPKTFRFGTWDVEGADWWNLQLIGVFDGERYTHFRNVPDFLNYTLQRCYRGFRWFAHFGGRYDMNFVFDHIRERGGWRVSLYTSGSLVMSMTLRQGDGRTIRFVDSYRLLPASLDSLTQTFDVEHKKQEYDFTEVRYSKQLIEYNEFDCRGQWEVIDAFYKTMGVQCETLAAQSLAAFRYDHLDRILWKPADPVSLASRAAYHGGRCEVFQRQGDLKCYDVNSMYPYVMREPMPVHFEGQSRQFDDRRFSFVDATVTVPDAYVPILPLRLEKLYFPVGKFRGTFTSEELIAAMGRGTTVEAVHRAYHFSTEPIFRDYIEKLYAEKKGASEPARTIAKLKMNSLYGKFGQSEIQKVYVSMQDAPAGTYPIHTPDGEPSGFGYVERTSGASHLLPHLAAAVTSKARLVLAESLNEDSYYCDTDSVFTTEDMATGPDLGQWDQVAVGHAHFYQPKLYKFNGEWKCKGLDRTQSIDGYVQGEPIMIERHASIKEAIRSGKEACRTVHVEKRMKDTKPKRIWEGENTRAWTIPELQPEIDRIERRLLKARQKKGGTPGRRPA